MSTESPDNSHDQTQVCVKNQIVTPEKKYTMHILILH